MMESIGAYYSYDENPRDPDKLIWGKFTEDEWERMTCEEMAEAIWEHAERSGNEGIR